MQSRPRRAGCALLPTAAALVGGAPPAEAQIACAAQRPLGAPPELVRLFLARPAPCPAPEVVAPRGGSLLLHVSAGGPVARRLGARTEFGSALRLPVVRRRGPWLGVVSTTMPDGEVGWVRQSAGVRIVARRRLRVVVDRSRAMLSLFVGDRLARRVPVGVGTAASPTPTGRFAITDKLHGRAFSPAYGCCILALSGHQHRLPAGWRGGDRLAIHGGPLGRSSAGCLHARDTDLRDLMRRVPVGTVVTIRA